MPVIIESPMDHTYNTLYVYYRRGHIVISTRPSRKKDHIILKPGSWLRLDNIGTK